MDFATQWSLPKAETARLAVPACLGIDWIRLRARDTGCYRAIPGITGSAGIAAALGYGIYAGLLVLLVGLWALVQAALGSAGRLRTLIVGG